MSSKVLKTLGPLPEERSSTSSPQTGEFATPAMLAQKQGNSGLWSARWEIKGGEACWRVQCGAGLRAKSSVATGVAAAVFAEKNSGSMIASEIRPSGEGRLHKGQAPAITDTWRSSRDSRTVAT